MAMAEAKMPLTAHLEELRWRIIKVLGGLTVGFAICYNFADWLFTLLTHPLLELNAAAPQGNVVRLIGTGVIEAFVTKLTVSLIAAVFLASPFILYQLWAFVAPGLLDSEKHYARPFVLFGTFFFILGAWFCYQMVLPLGCRFFMDQYATIRVDPQIRISEYLSFTSRLLLAFGCIFELPVITFFLARLGIVTYTWMLHSLRYGILVIFIVAAVLTPPDVASQLLMAGPLLLLYGASILVAYLFGKPKAPPSPGT